LVLENKASQNQKNVVLCNAAMAIKTMNPDLSFADCFYQAEKSLIDGLALKSFQNLLAINN
jgi:anthranilate phosphoribosyltransferase